jgi:TolA-binding protein
MKSRLSFLLLAMVLMVGCGGSKSLRAVDELQKKNDDLTQRVKTLEDNLLASEKKQIQLQQAVQGMNERLRDIEGQIDQVRMGMAR